VIPLQSPAPRTVKPLRIAVVGDFDGPHTRAWLRWFIERGHDMHAVSFYPPREPLDGVTVHALRNARPPEVRGRPAAAGGASRVPRGVMRLVHAMRYRRAGLRNILQSIAPDVVHAHFVVEHGFYAAVAGVRPLVVTAWGSDVLVEPKRDLVSGRIARWTLRRADAATSNNAWMAEQMVRLGARTDAVHVVTLGADLYDLELAHASVNRTLLASDHAPSIISTRAHESLYNIGEIIDAYDDVAHRRGDVRLVIAHEGSLTEELHQRARAAAGRVEFVGRLDRPAFRDALVAAEIFVSIPSSDGTSVALLQAMGAGCFPIVSDLPTQREWVEDGVNGFLVPLHRPRQLADYIRRALDDAELRRRAAEHNLALVRQRGLNETQMEKMEAIYRGLARR
jgi:glycosyltransferase involved in cell wall biosynthesis